MSLFECWNGHVSPASKLKGGRCPICGSRIATMDGQTDKEIKADDEGALTGKSDEEEDE